MHLTIHTARGDTVGPLAVTFEEACAKLESFPRMYLEPDGSFVWVSPETDSTGTAVWLLNGQLQDQGPWLDHVEINGTCAAEPLQAFLDALRGDAERLVFQLVSAGTFVEEAAAIELLAHE